MTGLRATQIAGQTLFLRFCLSHYVFISPLILNDSFTGYRIFHWQFFFFFQHLKKCPPTPFRAAWSDKTHAAGFIEDPLYMMKSLLSYCCKDSWLSKNWSQCVLVWIFLLLSFWEVTSIVECVDLCILANFRHFQLLFLQMFSFPLSPSHVLLGLSLHVCWYVPHRSFRLC